MISNICDRKAKNEIVIVKWVLLFCAAKKNNIYKNIKKYPFMQQKCILSYWKGIILLFYVFNMIWFMANYPLSEIYTEGGNQYNW